jgi:hypothetical protein
MTDGADELSANSPIVNLRAGREVEQSVSDALRAGQRTIVVIFQDPLSTRIPDAALAACRLSSRVLRIGRPLPELLDLQEMIGAAAGVVESRGLAAQVLARLLQTAEPMQSVVLVIDDADSLSRQSLYYLAQMLNVDAMDAPVLQIVFAAGPALPERLSHPDFEAFRDRITFVMEPSLESIQQERESLFYPNTRRDEDLGPEVDSNEGDLALGHGNTPSIPPRSVQLSPLPPHRRGRLSGRMAHRSTVANKVAIVLAMSCLVTIGYVVFLVFSDNPTQPTGPAVKSGVQQQSATAQGGSPTAQRDPRQSDKVIATLIDQATAAAAAGRFEEARRLEQAALQAARVTNGASSQQVSIAPAQALPPSESATTAGQPETLGKTDQPILFPKLAGAPAPDAVPDQPVNVTKRERMAIARDGEAARVAADLPAFAPIRVVLTFGRDNVARAERTTAMRQALTDAEVEVADIVAINAQRPRPRIGYYFRSDLNAAVGVSRRLESLLGSVEPVVLPLRGRMPPPGTIEIAVP